MTDRVNELAAVSLRKPVKIFVDSNKSVAWNLQQEFVRIRPSQEAQQVQLFHDPKVVIEFHDFILRKQFWLPFSRVPFEITSSFSFVLNSTAIGYISSLVC